jgi:anti-sigma28 factor (negative regulator of flagellin synthesis)
MKTTRERAEEKRAEKLEAITEAIANGRLTVRKMTEEERQKYPPVPNNRPAKPGRGYR